MAFGLALASAHRLAYRVCLHSIHDAIGIRMNDLPMSPDKILEALWAQEGK